MRSFDTETHLFATGIAAPPLVCASTASDDGTTPRLLSKVQAIDTFEAMLDGTDTIAGANIAFDMVVMAIECAHAGRPMLPKIFAAYDANRVHDVLIAQALDAIANGHLLKDPRTGAPICNPSTGKQSNRYSLAVCVDLVLGRHNAKENDFWRKRYALLENIPIDQWPEEARLYPIDDAVNTLQVALAQRAFRNQGNLADQCRADFAMKLGAVWGLRTDRANVAALKAEMLVLREATIKRFSALGWLKWDDKESKWKHDSKIVKKLIAQLYGASGVCPTCKGSGTVPNAKGKPVGCTPRNQAHVSRANPDGVFCDTTGLDLASAPSLPRSDGGGVSENRDTLMECGHDDLSAYGEGGEDKVLDTYVPFLEAGVNQPITLSPNVLLNTGRSSYDGVIQLLPRAGAARACFRSRDGYWYCSTDYPALELCTLGQLTKWVVGESVMLDTINATGDPSSLHTAMAARVLGRPFDAEFLAAYKKKDKVIVETRQACKPINFGIPGGMGAAKLVLINRKPDTGTTTAANGRKYNGIRFCVLIGGEPECGAEKVIEWKGRDTPPICKKCVELVEYQLKKSFFDQWPEVKEYFAWVNDQIESTGEVPSFDPTAADGIARVRGGVGFCDGANNGFQSLAGDVAKRAYYLVAREAFLAKPGDALYGVRPIPLIHDEIISEMPIATAHLAGPRQAELMTEALHVYTPDLNPIKVDPALMRHWWKAAEPVYVEGKLVPWWPKDWPGEKL